MNSFLTILLSLAYGFLVLRSEVLHDYKRWKAEEYGRIKHGKRWRLRACMCTPIIAGLTIALAPSKGFLIWAPITSTILVALGWWLTFDGWFNNIRGFNWWYAGSDDPKNAHTDDIIHSLRKWQHIALKAVSLSTFIVLYILILFR